MKGGGEGGGEGSYRPELAARYPDARLFRRTGEDEREGRAPKGGGTSFRPPRPGKWSEAIDEWVAEHEKDVERDRYEIDECGRRRKRPRRPRPYLDATSNFGPQIIALATGEAGTVRFTVWNDGNYPAWTCYVELYEGPGGYGHPLGDYELRGQRLVTLHPGERREVSVPWIRERQTGRVVGLVYDPLLDPRGFDVVEQSNRHITSVHFTNLD